MRACDLFCNRAEEDKQAVEGTERDVVICMHETFLGINKEARGCVMTNSKGDLR